MNLAEPKSMICLARFVVCCLTIIIVALSQSALSASAPKQEKPFINDWQELDAERDTNIGADLILNISRETNLCGVSSIPDTNTVLVGGEFGILMRAQKSNPTKWSVEHLSGTGDKLCGIAFADGHTGVAVGAYFGDILRTEDGGATWKVVSVERPMGNGAGLNLYSVAFSDPKNGFAVGFARLSYNGPYGGIVLRTRDGGKTWDYSAGAHDALTGIAFCDSQSGVAVGSGGTVLRTEDGGATWQAIDAGTDKDLHKVAFADCNSGIVVGDDWTLLRTDDRGRTWRKPESWQKGGSIFGSYENLYAVSFANALTGVAVGRGGEILRTQDGGDHWQAISYQSDVFGDLRAAVLTDDGQGFVVGEKATIVYSGPAKFAPMLDHYQITETPVGDIHVNAWIINTGGEKLSKASLQIRSGEQDWSKYLDLERPSQEAGPWSISIDPARFNIATNSSIAFQLRIEGDFPTLQPIALQSHVWRPWIVQVWKHWKAPILAATGALGTILLYVAAFVLILIYDPLRLASVNGATGLRQIPIPAGSLGFFVGLIRGAIELTAIPWFVTRTRVRAAWIAAYNRNETTFSDLGKLARPEFLKSDDVIDAWVEKQLECAYIGLSALELMRTRRIYVALPVRLGDQEAGRVIEKPEPNDLRHAFAHNRNVIVIVGRGGSGKSTLACAIARWAMSNDPTERLSSHRTLPVFVLQDTDNLLLSVESALREMLPGCELPQDLLAALLEKRRILVIVDGLSERDEPTRRHVVKLFQQATPINALLVTTRVEPVMGAMERTLLFPEALTGKRLVPFIIDYLDRRSQDAVFDDLQAIELGVRVLSLVRTDKRLETATPLLALLFVESAVYRARHGLSLDELPQGIPEVYRDYLRRLNPDNGSAEGQLSHDIIEQASGVLAMCSLGEARVPSDFERNTAIESVAASGFATTAGRIVDQIIRNGVIDQRDIAGVKLLRFSLDPAAEYLAALHRMRTMGKDSDAWKAEINTLTRIEGYPAQCDGYLQALAVCYRAYRNSLGLPTLILPWDA